MRNFIAIRLRILTLLALSTLVVSTTYCGFTNLKNTTPAHTDPPPPPPPDVADPTFTNVESLVFSQYCTACHSSGGTPNPNHIVNTGDVGHLPHLDTYVNAIGIPNIA